MLWEEKNKAGGSLAQESSPHTRVQGCHEVLWQRWKQEPHQPTSLEVGEQAWQS